MWGGHTLQHLLESPTGDYGGTSGPTQLGEMLMVGGWGRAGR